MRNRIDVNITIGKNVSEEDKISFFGNLQQEVTEPIFEFDEGARFPDILAEVGIFSSKNEARKNGWHKDVPDGWTDLTIGKLKNRVCILKIL